ncbi:MAG: DsrE family protein [Nitrospirae bacterium]|jgi:sulfur relay (sulfurtransferase) DsrF/TusC family protein|nr:DsrE family protein [Nitrospirota bacterium]
MANHVLVIFEKPIYLSFEPVDPHLFATALGTADTPLEISVLLKDSGVNYAVSKQQVSLKILGQEVQEADTTPARLLAFMMEHGARVRVVEEHLTARGLDPGDLIDGVERISEGKIARLVEEHDSVIVW